MVPPRVHPLRPSRSAGLLAGEVLISGRGLQRRASYWPVPAVRTNTTAGGHRKGDGLPARRLEDRAGQRLLSGAFLIKGSGEPVAPVRFRRRARKE